MATIGRGDAVQLPIGLKMTGVLAWLGWIALHIVFCSAAATGCRP